MTSCCENGDCNGMGKFSCARCKEAKYCSSKCQQDSWRVHKATCVKIGEQTVPYQWDPPSTMAPKHFTVTEMKKGPDQPMDPPVDDDDEILNWWGEKEFKLGGKVVVKASYYPSRFKELIRQGLKDKRLTWEYLLSDNFLRMAAYATLPAQDLLNLTEFVFIRSEVKPSLQAHLQIATEHFWRTKGLPGQGDYDKAIMLCLRRNNITLPFRYHGHSNDEFRVICHSDVDNKDCDCYPCQIRQYENDKREEVWENMRKREGKKGRFMSSWTAIKEFELKQMNDYLWDIDTTGPGEYKKWRFQPDEGKDIQHITKKEITDINKILDIAYAMKRLPLHDEMDYIYSVACGDRVPVSPVKKPASATSSASSASGFSAAAISGAARDVIDGIASLADVASRMAVSGSSNGAGGGQNGSSSSSATAATARADPVWMKDCVDDDYNLAKYRPRRAATQKRVSYVEGNESESEQCTPESQVTDGDGLNDDATTGKGSGGRGNKSSAHKRGRGGGDSGDSGEASDWSDSEASGSEDDEDDEDDSDTDSSAGDGDSDGDASDEEVGRGRQRVKAASAPRSGSGKPRAPRGEGGAGGRIPVRWAEEMDVKLREAHKMFHVESSERGRGSGTGYFDKVAEYMDMGLTAQQCSTRWTSIKTAEENRKKGEWSEEEIQRLTVMVEQEISNPTGKLRDNVKTINWITISKELHREYQDCTSKWKLLLAAKMKKGPFTAEEDAIILQRVREYGEGYRGLWVMLEKELGRRTFTINRRWKDTLSKR